MNLVTGVDQIAPDSGVSNISEIFARAQLVKKARCVSAHSCASCRRVVEPHDIGSASQKFGVQCIGRCAKIESQRHQAIFNARRPMTHQTHVGVNHGHVQFFEQCGEVGR